MPIDLERVEISSDKSRLDRETIYRFLANSYWANKRPKAVIDQSIDHSVCYGAYYDGRQIGFARVVTDHATFYWLCDVYVDEAYRGCGVGKKLVETIVRSEAFRNLFGLLGTRDAHGLYQRFGFATDAQRFMGRKPDFLTRTSS